jgi:5-methylcytosine-specific restriction endonuclease McrA
MGTRSQHQVNGWIRDERRSAIYGRDLCTCVWCGKDASTEPMQLTLDHVVPKAMGGSNKSSNLVTACADCNSLRRALSTPAFARLLGDEGAGPWTEIVKRVRRQAARAVYSPITGKRFN